MTIRVVCVARILGAEGGDVARLVAEELAFRYVDEEIVQRAAQDQHVTVEQISNAERRQGMFERLMGGSVVAGGEAYVALGGYMGFVPTDPQDTRSLRSMIREAIHEAADEGDVVIVSHAASFALADRDDVLRVLVTASPQIRADRAAAANALDPKRAAKAVADDDAGRAAYLKQGYGVKAELPCHYDLVLNSDRLSPAQLAELIVQLVRSSNG